MWGKKEKESLPQSHGAGKTDCCLLERSEGKFIKYATTINHLPQSKAVLLLSH